MPAPWAAAPPVTRTCESPTIAEALTSRSPPWPPVAVPSAIVRFWNVTIRSPAIVKIRALPSPWMIVVRALAPMIETPLGGTRSPPVSVVVPGGIVTVSSVAVVRPASVSAARIVVQSVFAHDPVPSLSVVTVKSSARAEGAAPSVATIPAATKRARQRMPERH